MEDTLRQFITDLRDEAQKLDKAKGSPSKPIPTTHEIIQRILNGLNQVASNTYGGEGGQRLLLLGGPPIRPISTPRAIPSVNSKPTISAPSSPTVSPTEPA